MDNSSLHSRSVSLSAQLIVTFVVLVAATVAGLTFVADATSLASLEAQASSGARTAAQTRDQLLTQLLALRLRRAEGFLVSAESLCSEQTGRHALAWADVCIKTMLTEFQKTERARGALLTYRGRQVLNVGEPPVPGDDTEGKWIATVVRQGGETLYVTRGRHGDASLILEFNGDDVRPLIAERSGLGQQGEAFLLDENGLLLTPLRYPVEHADLAGVVRQCRAGVEDREQRDYRGERVIPAFHPVAALRGACIVANINYREALAPAADLRVKLVTQGVTFILAGVLLSLVAARRIAAPVRRLAATARALQAGDFTQPVPVDGPAEVQGLGRAFAAMANDLAELVSHEQSGRRAAEAANRSKDQFLAMLSHELRTPLTAVLGWAHTLRTGSHDSDRVQRAAIAIERSAESQRRLIEDLLDVTGIAAGRVRMNLEPTVLSEVVDGALDAVGPRALEKGVRIDTAIEEKLTVEGDPQRLQQVVWNLVWNAVKFTPPGGTVSVRVRGTNGLAELTVTDDGVGIDPEFLPHVFGWFRREDRETRSVDEGLGLGLALVRQLAELHGGSVRAESEGRNRGSTFIVTLPLIQSASSATVTPMPPRPVPAAAAPFIPARVLVVDDDAGSREALRVLLEQAGAQVTTVESAAEARRQLRSAGTDVLISDIAMAEESGYTLLETIRAEGYTLPCIALTGYARREDADRAYTAGFDVHLPKPVDPGVLLSVLAAVTKRTA